MKKIFLLLSLLTCTLLSAQDFTVLSTDAEGDPTINGIADLRSISYAIDESNDSLWFKVELHTTIPGDLGIVFGIDTDLIPENGLNWNSSNNMALLPEVVFTVNRNFIDPSTLYGFSNNDLNHVSTIGDNDSSIVINMKLSTLDSDGRFNLILGASTFDCDTNNRSIFDDLPDTGFLTIDPTTPTSEISKPVSINIYPNPVRDYIFLENINNQPFQTIRIFNNRGQLIQEVSKEEEVIQRIDCTNLINGIYYLSIFNTHEIFNTKFIKSS